MLNLTDVVMYIHLACLHVRPADLCTQINISEEMLICPKTKYDLTHRHCAGRIGIHRLLCAVAVYVLTFTNHVVCESNCCTGLLTESTRYTWPEGCIVCLVDTFILCVLLPFVNVEFAC